MILFIDVSNPEVRLALIAKDKISRLQFASRYVSENLLSNIQKLLEKNRSDLQSLKKITVVTGPGPFSRMRTASATANALAYALDIPVVGIEASKVPKNLASISKLSGEKQVLPFYQKPPNITSVLGSKGGRELSGGRKV